jgi:serine/threonine protein kinase
MSNKDKHWEELIHLVTGGESINWDGKAQSSPEHAELIKQLQALSKVHQVFNANSDHINESNLQKRACLFTWRHLQVVEKIGEGSFGEVFRAFDPVLSRDVALKLLRPQYVASFRAKNFINEARSLAKIRHPRVLAVHGADMDNGRVGFWSDYLHGKTLSATDLKAESSIMDLTEAIAEALDVVHEAGLIHGDVKASNVFVNADGHITLMDFGASSGHDLKSEVIGSPLMMAPELFSGQLKSEASDIYALGVMIYHLATGQYPVKGNNLAEIALAHHRNESARESCLPLNRSFRKLIMSMLDPHPEKRPDAKAVKNAVLQIRSEPQRRKKTLVLSVIFSSLLLASLISGAGIVYLNRAQHVIERELERTNVINDFLTEIIESPHKYGQGNDMKVVELLEFTSQNAQKKFKNDPFLLASIDHSLSKAYNSLMIFEPARTHAKRSADLYLRHSDQLQQQTLDVMFDHSFALAGLGKFAESNEVCHEINELIDQNPTFIPNNRRAVNEQLGYNLMQLRDYETAFGHLNDPSMAPISPTEANDSRTASVLQLKAELHFRLKEYKQSEKVARQSIQWLQKWVERPKNKNKKPYLLGGKFRLALALFKQDKLMEAKTEFIESLELAKSYHGEDSDFSQLISDELSSTHYKLGEYSEALKIQQKGYHKLIDALGQEHEKTQRLAYKYSRTLLAMGRLDAAQKLIEINLPITVNNRMSIEPYYRLILADLMNQKNEFRLAEEMANKALHLLMQQPDSYRTMIARSLSQKAVALGGLARQTEGKDIQQQALDMLLPEEKNTEVHFYLQWNAVNFHLNEGQLELATPLLEDLLINQTKVLVKEHPWTIRSKELLSTIQ